MGYKDKNSPEAIASRKRCQERWRQKNKDKWNEYQREYRQKVKDGKFRVYLLSDDMYVGYTGNIQFRMQGHRKDGRNTNNLEILHICDTEEDALKIEKIYHNIGFKGTHPFRFKKSIQ